MSDRRSRVATGFIWFAACLGMLTCWALFICNILVWRDTRAITTCIGASLPAPLVGWLAFRKADRALWHVTLRASLYALVSGVLIMLLLPAVGDLGSLVFVAGWAYLGPLALGLSGVALRLGWPKKSVAPWALAYVLIGTVLILPIPPISTSTYNPVGLFFPVWGAGAPLCVTIAGLVKHPRKDSGSADTEDQV